MIISGCVTTSTALGAIAFTEKQSFEKKHSKLQETINSILHTSLP